MTANTMHVDDRHRFGEPVIRAVAMPADTNPSGDIFGGWLMAHMDMAAGSVAARRAKGRCVTVAVTSMTFHEPVKVGDELSVYASVVKVGKSSITVEVEAWRRQLSKPERTRVTEGGFVFVAIDSERKPRPVPPLD